MPCILVLTISKGLFANVEQQPENIPPKRDLVTERLPSSAYASSEAITTDDTGNRYNKDIVRVSLQQAVDGVT